MTGQLVKEEEEKKKNRIHFRSMAGVGFSYSRTFAISDLMNDDIIFKDYGGHITIDKRAQETADMACQNETG
ncbi:hypothetical protein PG994_009161 [Apiospora phragmitis]|uniref:Uncharacterized protein n=1 Tax=Apiospora phragmitis TaxID=2905665 RepID=A0ABR1ULD5_9PEZI